MRIQLVDPSAFTPPYDHALAAALAREGADVELVTSHFAYGPVPAGAGYRVSEDFYRRSAARDSGSRSRRALKLAEHVPDMLRYRRHARSADVVHYQWLALEQLDGLLLPRKRPRVLTAHNVSEHEGRLWQAAARRRLLDRMDAVVVHSEHGARRLSDEFRVPPERVRVIPHGAFDYLAQQASELPLPQELAAVEGPVILFFGLLRHYKGADVLLEAFRSLEGAELWVVGMPRIDMAPLRELARRARGTVRFVPRFVTDPEIPAYFRRADVVVLPYRDIDQSGVLYTALAFGKPLVLSSVGGFVELAERHGAARLVPPGEPEPLASALRELLRDREARAALGAAAVRAATGPYSWPGAARQTMDLYRELLRG